jgi:hypothetical protein
MCCASQTATNNDLLQQMLYVCAFGRQGCVHRVLRSTATSSAVIAAFSLLEPAAILTVASAGAVLLAAANACMFHVE